MNLRELIHDIMVGHAMSANTGLTLDDISEELEDRVLDWLQHHRWVQLEEVDDGSKQ